MITGKIRSDDGAVTNTFDATPWFLSAEDEDVRLLFAFDMRHCERADEVAYHCIDQTGVQRVMNYLDDNQPTQPAGAKCKDGMPAPCVGFEVTINRYEALAWLMANRRPLGLEMYALAREDAMDRAQTAGSRALTVAG